MRDTLPARVTESAARAPGAVAVKDGDRILRYGELAVAMNGVAARLAAAGVEGGDRVGLLLPKSIETVVALLGAMRAGAAYVPVDPGAPMRRARRILADAGVAALVTAAPELERRPGLLGEAESPVPRLVLFAGGMPAGLPGGELLPADSLETAAAATADPLPPLPATDDLAYLLYTSGSTGDPKGVMLTHGNALAFVDWAVAEVGVTARDVLSSHAPFHFDLSVFDLYAAFVAGAAVTLVPEALAYFPKPLARWIAVERVTVWYSVPTVLGKLATSGALAEAKPDALRAVLFAGEVFPIPALRALQRAVPGVQLLNLYGPTETNVCTWHRVAGPIPEDRREALPIGHPCPYAECLVVTDGGRVAENAEEGELWVRGPSTHQGYWNDPERTARVFAPDPRPGRSSGASFYRTGDRVRWMEDGQLAFLGRRDAQVKARGYRIELGDVESALHDHAEVEEAAALVVTDTAGASRLFAAVTLRAGARATAAALQRHCLEIVPRYMVPESILVLPEMPRTTTGKVDRLGLSHRFTEAARPEVS